MLFGADIDLHICMKYAFECLAFLCIFIGPFCYSIPYICESAGLNIIMFCRGRKYNLFWKGGSTHYSYI